MKFLAIVLIAASAHAAAADSDSDAAAQRQACLKEQAALCETKYARGKEQCESYFLPATEARPLCLESARKRLELCISRTGKACSDQR